METNKGNGRSGIIMALLGFIQAIILMVCAWAGNNIVQAKADIAVLNANYTNIMQALNEIKQEIKNDKR